MHTPTETNAGLIITGLRPFPWFFMNLIDRLLADYALSSLTVYVDRSVEARYAPLAAKAGRIVDLKPLPSSGEVGNTLIFRLEDRKAVTGLEWYDHGRLRPNTGIRFPENARVLSTDILGRTFDPSTDTRRHGLGKDSSLFQKQSDLADPLEGNFIYAPYVPQWRNPAEVGVAPFARHREDAFGFRTLAEIDTMTRDPNTVVVQIYGGSAAYGLYTSEARSITGWIRRLGRHRLLAQGDARVLKVLNFSIPSTTITEASLLYTLFGQRLEPEYVILHYGWNEPSASRHADANHLKADLPLSRPIWQYFYSFHSDNTIAATGTETLWKRPRNTAADLISPIMARTSLFAQTVRQTGSRFIAGIQSSPFHRRTPHPREAAYLARYLSETPMNPASTLETLSAMRNMAGAAIELLGQDDVINFEPVFETLSDRHLCFWDRAHMTTEGCRLVAEHYVDRMFGPA